MNGKLSVESQKNVGSNFIFEFNAKILSIIAERIVDTNSIRKKLKDQNYRYSIESKSKNYFHVTEEISEESIEESCQLLVSPLP